MTDDLFQLTIVFSVSEPVEDREPARKVAVVVMTVFFWETPGEERLADIFEDAIDQGIEVLVAVAPNEDFMIDKIKDEVGPYVDSENKIVVNGGVSHLFLKAEDFKQKICGGQFHIFDFSRSQ